MKNKIGVLIVILIVIAAGIFIWKNQAAAPATTVDSQTQTQNTANTKKAGFSMADVAAHNNADSCYVAVGTKVYNVTDWIKQHPGGQQAILGLCGTDGTAAFSAQHGSNAKAQAALASFLIGDLIN